MGPTPPDRVALLRIVALRALFGARNGLIYGAKVRAPHSLVMTGAGCLASCGAGVTQQDKCFLEKRRA